MALYDIETFMSELDTAVKANIQTYITAVNTEKGDTLLETFVSDSYKSWSIPDILPYPMSYLQFISSDPRISSTNPGYAHSMDYSVRITCFILETGDGNVPIFLLLVWIVLYYKILQEQFMRRLRFYLMLH